LHQLVMSPATRYGPSFRLATMPLQVELADEVRAAANDVIDKEEEADAVYR